MLFRSLSRSLPTEINKSVAVSGTFCPVHTVFGINPKVYNIMLNALSVQTIANFKQNMFANCSKNDSDIKSADRTLENLREELINIKANSKERAMEDGFQFDTVILTRNDKIFPFRAQENFFENHPHKVVLETGHFPFFEFETFDNILEV